jgi:hypothetical protein
MSTTLSSSSLGYLEQTLRIMDVPFLSRVLSSDDQVNAFMHAGKTRSDDPGF